jgi:hypothetical protein
MKKILTAIIVGLFLLSQSPTAHSATASYKVDKVLSGTVTTKVSYGSSNCKKIAIKYKASTGLSYPSQTILFGLSTKAEDEVASAEVKVGNTYSLDFGGAPYSGTVYMEVCKTPRTVLVDEECDPDLGQEDGTECEYEEVSGVKPGTYYFEAVVMQIRPLVIKSSKTIKIVITK